MKAKLTGDKGRRDREIRLLDGWTFKPSRLTRRLEVEIKSVGQALKAEASWKETK